MQTAPPTYRPYESSKYNQIMGRECPTDRECRMGTERRDWDRDFNRNWEMTPYWGNDRTWDRFDRNWEMTPFWGNDRRFDMMPWNYDRFFNRNWDRFNMDRFNREMMPWGFDRFFNREMMPFGFDRFNREMMPWWNNFNRFFDWKNWNDLWNVNFRPSNPIEYYCLTHPIRVLNREGDRELFLTYDLKGFKPEEINCTFDRKERCIVVEAKHEVKEGKEHHIMRTFYRKYRLPTVLEKCDLSKCEIKCHFTNEGFINIELPLPRLTKEELTNCPHMYKQLTAPFNNEYFGCPTTCNTTPINTKVM